MSNPQDAAWALLSLFAEDMYADPTALNPPADPRLTAAGWSVCGYLTGVDALLRVKSGSAQRVFYGFLAQSDADPDQFALVVRGTAGILEWIEDAEFLLRAHPAAGLVEDGFYGIYQTFAFSAHAAEGPLLDGIASMVGTTGRVMVVGHSLGAALATYLALDLSDAHRLGDRVSARLFASPRPGNDKFAEHFDQVVKDYRGYAFEPDLVPRVPFSLGYRSLPRTTVLPVDGNDIRIRLKGFCTHHAYCYAGLLSKTSIAGLTVNDASTPLCVISD